MFWSRRLISMSWEGERERVQEELVKKLRCPHEIYREQWNSMASGSWNSWLIFFSLRIGSWRSNRKNCVSITRSLVRVLHKTLRITYATVEAVPITFTCSIDSVLPGTILCAFASKKARCLVQKNGNFTRIDDVCHRLGRDTRMKSFCILFF